MSGSPPDQSIAPDPRSTQSTSNAGNQPETTRSPIFWLSAPNLDELDGFGRSIAISGNTIVVGAPGEDSRATGVNGKRRDNRAPGAGAAYVFVRDGEVWRQQAYLKASNTRAIDLFGWSVAISGDTVVVGAVREDSASVGVDGDQGSDRAENSGAAYVFVRSGNRWTQQAYLKASNTDADDWFGHTVAISGNTIVVGAPLERSHATGIDGDQGDNSMIDSGAAYVFVRENSQWRQDAYLKASNTDIGDTFGWAVAIDGESIVVGAYQESSSAVGVNGDQWSNSAYYSGAAYVFVRNSHSWAQQAYLKASNTGPFDRFGFSVAISGDALVVGSYSESSGSPGVDGDQADNSADGAGAAYVFRRDGTTWSQEAYLKASNPDGAIGGDEGDAFGTAVAISENTVVVGAINEDSDATGVGGNSTDNSSKNKGAAYVFTRETSGSWSQLAYLKASIGDSFDEFGSSVGISENRIVGGAPATFFKGAAFVFNDYCAPVVNIEPENLSLKAGNSAILRVAAGGCTPLTYQWFRDGQAVVDDGNVSGATSPALAIASASKSEQGDYTVLITNDFGTVASETVSITVCSNPSPPCDNSDIFPAGLPDCLVDIRDFGELLSNFAPGVPGKSRAQGDVFPLGSGDGYVDYSDLDVMFRDFGSNCK